jgi:hypothetical protein
MPKPRILVITQYFWPESFRINDVVHGLRDLVHEVAASYTGKPNYSGGNFVSRPRVLRAGEDRDGILLICARHAPAVT